MVSWESAPSSANSSTPSSPKAVQFAGVAGVSRPATTDEHWACYYYEQHAADCRSCREPYVRYKAGKKLCRDGNKLAATISHHLYQKDGDVYSRIKEEGQKPRVEKPSGYDRSWLLLKAIEKGLKHGRPFLASEKQASSESKKHDRRDSLSPRDHHVRPVYARKPVESYEERRPEYALPLRQVQTEPELYTNQPNPFQYQQYDHNANRGSLYDTELARMIEREQQEAQMGYKMEIREPTPRISARGSVRHKHRPHSLLYLQKR